MDPLDHAGAVGTVPRATRSLDAMRLAGTVGRTEREATRQTRQARVRVTGQGEAAPME
jgi:hypothetical protein